MKKFCISLVCLSIILLTVICGNYSVGDNAEYLRIHIRANSNGAEDQAVKYAVRDEVVSLITPYAANADSKESLQTEISNRIKEIERTANEVLIKRGFNYESKAKLVNEKFPERVYDGVTLKEGYYDAIIVELGSGKGDNWWCVVYPPLCFIGSGNGDVKYKSKIVEIIKKWRSERENNLVAE